jgi:hypothetical protein
MGTFANLESQSLLIHEAYFLVRQILNTDARLRLKAEKAI